jgi:hypothetical protein
MVNLDYGNDIYVSNWLQMQIACSFFELARDLFDIVKRNILKIGVEVYDASELPPQIYTQDQMKSLECLLKKVGRLVFRAPKTTDLFWDDATEHGSYLNWFFWNDAGYKYYKHTLARMMPSFLSAFTELDIHVKVLGNPAQVAAYERGVTNLSRDMNEYTEWMDVDKHVSTRNLRAREEGRGHGAGRHNFRLRALLGELQR